MSRHHIIRQQRQRRRAGIIRRVEFVLDADNDQHHDINDFLQSLPHGAAGEFIRQALLEKIARETAPEPETKPASEQFNEILAELSALREAVEMPAPVVVTPTTRQHHRPPDDNGEIELAVKAESGGKSSANFLQSLLQLQEHR